MSSTSLELQPRELLPGDLLRPLGAFEELGTTMAGVDAGAMFLLNDPRMATILEKAIDDKNACATSRSCSKPA
jgi:hypothetical protein